jgi:hypothetical protein
MSRSHLVVVIMTPFYSHLCRRTVSRGSQRYFFGDVICSIVDDSQHVRYRFDCFAFFTQYHIYQFTVTKCIEEFFSQRYCIVTEAVNKRVVIFYGCVAFSHRSLRFAIIKTPGSSIARRGAYFLSYTRHWQLT